jgi:hypothetical protein
MRADSQHKTAARNRILPKSCEQGNKFFLVELQGRNQSWVEDPAKSCSDSQLTETLKQEAHVAVSLYFCGYLLPWKTNTGQLKLTYKERAHQLGRQEAATDESQGLRVTVIATGLTFPGRFSWDEQDCSRGACRGDLSFYFLIDYLINPSTLPQLLHL